ncbi:MAG: hypothetical protein AVDCRST_MAG73-1721 [uncultured Thermomicrobiales bacterium]|uniref:Uncharacterized protein n=1 Tax=uncultured Thermomicrobiales bacterium TaxID=1645740 RepID=A0A6J4U4R2_9BACT|nr:MAG: hypothetical protein AVDCRST_MAG73-1721 [uncultured Thermomicrobiales bacterium]
MAGRRCRPGSPPRISPFLHQTDGMGYTPGAPTPGGGGLPGRGRPAPWAWSDSRAIGRRAIGHPAVPSQSARWR